MAAGRSYPNWSFVVQVSDDEGNDLGVEIIYQFVDPRYGNRGKERVRNQVEGHLFHRFRRTGNHYHVIFEGSPGAAILIANDSACGVK